MREENQENETESGQVSQLNKESHEMQNDEES